jgi:ATP-binding cassette subfamily C (CFTR/MRP) protein 4
MDEKVRTSTKNPFTSANIISRLFICYISPLLTLGKKRPLREEDLADPCPTEESKRLTDRLETYSFLFIVINKLRA